MSCRVKTSAAILAKDALVNESANSNVQVAMAEWLRRLTRNQMGFPRRFPSSRRNFSILFSYFITYTSLLTLTFITYTCFILRTLC